MKILILNHKHIGDVLFTLPAVKSLRLGYPSARIDMLISDYALDVVRENPHVDNLFLRARGWKEKWELIRKFRRETYDIVLSFSRLAFELALYAWLSGSKRRYGFYNRDSFFFFTYTLKENHAEHFAKDHLKLALAAGGKVVPLLPEIFFSEEEKEWVEVFLKGLGIGGGEKVFGILLGGTTPFKEWHPPILREVVGGLSRRGRVLLLGDEAHRKIGEDIEREFPNVHNLAGRTTLRQAMLLCGACALFIGQDSGLTHISAALGVPTVAIYTATNPQRTHPLGKKVKVLYKPLSCAPCWGKRRCPYPKCIETITACDIEEAVEELLE